MRRVQSERWNEEFDHPLELPTKAYAIVRSASGEVMEVVTNKKAAQGAIGRWAKAYPHSNFHHMKIHNLETFIQEQQGKF